MCYWVRGISLVGIGIGFDFGRLVDFFMFRLVLCVSVCRNLVVWYSILKYDLFFSYIFWSFNDLYFFSVINLFVKLVRIFGLFFVLFYFRRFIYRKVRFRSLVGLFFFNVLEILVGR